MPLEHERSSFGPFLGCRPLVLQRQWCRFFCVRPGCLRAHTQDMAHVALATVHGMNYLLTWNCRHIANAMVLRAVGRACRGQGFEPPVVCTPEELMGY